MFDDHTLKKVTAALDHPTPLRFAANHVIISPGDAGVFMHFPLEGKVAIMSEDRVLQHVGVGSVFGEMALIDSVARSAKVMAASDCVLMAVNRTQFLKLIQSMPEVGLSLLRLIAQRLQTATAQSSR